MTIALILSTVDRARLRRRRDPRQHRDHAGSSTDLRGQAQRLGVPLHRAAYDQQPSTTTCTTQKRQRRPRATAATTCETDAAARMLTTAHVRRHEQRAVEARPARAAAAGRALVHRGRRPARRRSPSSSRTSRTTTDAFATKYDSGTRRRPGAATRSTIHQDPADVIDGARLFSILIALVVLIASILLIANTIQVAAAQRKNETSIMRLVGASRWMTELPFMLETIVRRDRRRAHRVRSHRGRQVLRARQHLRRRRSRTGSIPNLTTNDVLVAGGFGIIAGIVLAALTAFATLRLYVRL